MTERRPFPRQVALGLAYLAYLVWLAAATLALASLVGWGSSRVAAGLGLAGVAMVIAAVVIVRVTPRTSGRSWLIADEPACHAAADALELRPPRAPGSAEASWAGDEVR